MCLLIYGFGKRKIVRDLDEIYAVWNTYARGAATVLLYDKTLTREEALREWTRVMAERGILGSQLCVCPDLGMREAEVDIVIEEAQKIYQKKAEVAAQRSDKMKEFACELKEKLWKDFLEFIDMYIHDSRRNHFLCYAFSTLDSKIENLEKEIKLLKEK